MDLSALQVSDLGEAFAAAPPFFFYPAARRVACVAGCFHLFLIGILTYGALFVDLLEEERLSIPVCLLVPCDECITSRRGGGVKVCSTWEGSCCAVLNFICGVLIYLFFITRFIFFGCDRTGISLLASRHPLSTAAHTRSLYTHLRLRCKFYDSRDCAVIIAGV